MQSLRGLMTLGSSCQSQLCYCTVQYTVSMIANAFLSRHHCLRICSIADNGDGELDTVFRFGPVFSLILS